MYYSLVNANALILMSLCIDHDIGFIQHEHRDFFDVKHTEFRAPIQNFSRCANDDVVIQFGITVH